MANPFSNIPQNYQQFNTQTPGQQGVQTQLGNTINGLLNKPQQQFSFQPIRDNATEYFNKTIAPTIAERFAAMGGNGTLRSGGELSATNAAGRGLSRDLAYMENQFNRENQQYDRSYLQNLLQLHQNPTQESFFSPEKAGLQQQLSETAGTFGPHFLDYLKNYQAPSQQNGQQQAQQPQQGGGLRNYLTAALKGGATGAVSGAIGGGGAGAIPGAFLGALQGLIQQYFGGSGNQQPQNNLSQFSSNEPALNINNMNSGFAIGGAR